MKRYRVSLTNGVEMDVEGDEVKIDDNGILLFSWSTESEDDFPVAMFKDWICCVEL